MFGFIIFVIFFIIIYYVLSITKQGLSNPDSSLPKELKVNLNSNNFFDYIDDVKVGDKVKIWGSPHTKSEIRVYCSGTVGGDGLLSVFKDNRIHSFLIEQKKKQQFNLVSYVIKKNKTNLIVSLKKEENTYDPDEIIRKYIEKLKKSYKPRPTTKFIIQLNTKKRIYPKKDNDKLSLGININKNDLEKFGNKIYSFKDMNSYSKWLNNYLWLEYNGEKISFENHTGHEFVSQIVRSFFSGYSFDLKVDNRFDRVNTYNREQEKNNPEKMDFICTCEITPYKS